MSEFSKSFVSKVESVKLPYDCDNFSEVFEHILIQTNNVCTRKCKACYFWMEDPEYVLEKLEENAVYRVFDQLAEIGYDGRIGLFDINEPLTDPRIYSFVEYAAKRLEKAWKMIITNGDLLNEWTLSKLVEAWIDQISVSVYDDRTFDKISELQKASDAGRIHFELMDFRNEVFADNRGGNIEHIDYGGTYLKAPCERIYKIMVIKSSGNVVSCFGDFFQLNIMGSIYDTSILDIWFWEKFRELRRNLDLRKRWRYALCRKCNYPGAGWFFKKPNIHE